MMVKKRSDSLEEFFMAPIRYPGPTGHTPIHGRDPGVLQRGNSLSAGPAGSGATHPDVPDPQVRELQEMGLELLQMALDLAGIFDPTPVSDGASGLLALSRGQWLDALISGASMVPYVGDLAKAGKLPRYLRSLERAVELADRSADAARILRPGLEKLKNVLDLIPTGSNQSLAKMKMIVERSLKSAPQVAKNLPDVSRQFTFRRFEQNGQIYQEASGRLGVPDRVRTHRNPTAQRGVSSGTGDDAGHLIGDRFGAPGGFENLSQQNWIANRSGTFKQLEDTWAQKLKEGTGIEVQIRDVTRQGEDRPFMRKAAWTEIAPDGSRTQHELLFANTHSAKSREMQGVPPTVNHPQSDNVIPLDFVNKRRRE
jgi:hypothetical protein